MKINVGDYVETYCFSTIRIDAIFREEQDAHACGYKEPIHHRGIGYIVLGKPLDKFHMIFAAVPNPPT